VGAEGQAEEGRHRGNRRHRQEWQKTAAFRHRSGAMSVAAWAFKAFLQLGTFLRFRTIPTAEKKSFPYLGKW